MTTQMIAEAASPWDGGKKARPDLMIHAPHNEKMADRGGSMFDESQPQPENNDTRNKSVEIEDMLMPWEEEAIRSKEAKAIQNQRMNRDGGGEEKTSE